MEKKGPVIIIEDVSQHVENNDEDDEDRAELDEIFKNELASVQQFTRMPVYTGELSESVPLRASPNGHTRDDDLNTRRTGTFFSLAYHRHKKIFRIAFFNGVAAILIILSLAALTIYIRSGSSPSLNDEAPQNDYDQLLNFNWPIPDVNSQDPDLEEDLDSNSERLSLLQSRRVSDNVLKASLKDGQEALQSRHKTEHLLAQLGYVPEKRSPASHHQYFNRPSDDAMKLSRKGFFYEYAYKSIVNRMNASKMEARDGALVLPIPELSDVVSADEDSWCVGDNSLASMGCNKTLIYRTADGSCNNLNSAHWGAANQPFRRIMMPVYFDGISALRNESSDDIGTAIPNAREVSLEAHSDAYREDAEVNMMFPLWGQFVDHDITATAASSGPNGTQISCCDKGKLVKPQHPECIPIYLAQQDEFYYDAKTQCMSVLRSAPYPTCEAGPRQQFNQITAYLDLSVIYGSSINQTASLRTMKEGRLRTFYTDDGRPLMPIIWDPKDSCNTDEEVNNTHFCFISGDARVNEVTPLTSMHLIWTRHHNRISENLYRLNPHWDDETVFQESRRIAIAEFQHITYKEYLPVLLGSPILRKAGLELLDSGFYGDYDQDMDATISNEFAASAYRFGHSMIQGLLRMIGPEGKNEDYISLYKLFFNPFRLWHPGRMDAIIRGTSTMPASRVDTYFTKQLSQHLFQERSSMFGMDLVAINIQRGRDHGLPPYPEWRKLCGLKTLENFNDTLDVWDDEAREMISQVYRSINDVDSYTGMLAEKPVPGGKLGPTMICVIADQFLRLRKGDRFWYEGNIQLKPFTSSQLAEIRKIKLSTVLCDNSDGIVKMQEDAMLQTTEANPLVSCKQLVRMDYTPWKEAPRSQLLINPDVEYDPESNSTEKPTTSSDTSYSDLDYEVWGPDSIESYYDDDYNGDSVPPGKLVNFTTDTQST